MSNPSKHLSDIDIVRFIDREVSPAAADMMREHLENCAACHARVESAAGQSGELNDFYTAQSSSTLSSATKSRDQLQRNIALDRSHPPRKENHAGNRLFYLAAVAAFVLIAAAVTLRRASQETPRTPGEPSYAESGNTPNRSLTPGDFRNVSLTDICSSVDDDLDPAVPATTQTAVLEEYGIRSGSRLQTYQIDYLVNPQLGGTNDIKNLWPQPDRDGIWNAKAKDELEKQLHQMVCDKSLDLSVAQREIATDWISAYKRYFHRQSPV